MDTALSLSRLSCRQRPLCWQVEDKKTTARQGSSGAKKGLKEKKWTKQVERVWKCTKRANLYFDKQIDYLHGFGGSFCAEKVLNGQRGWGRGRNQMQILEGGRRKWNHQTETKTGSGRFTPHKHWDVCPRADDQWRSLTCKDTQKDNRRTLRWTSLKKKKR